MTETGDYGSLPTIYARATAFLVRELVARGMTQEEAEQQALDMVLAQAGEMKAALGMSEKERGEHGN